MSESKKDSKYFSMDDELFDLKHGDAKDKSVAALKMVRGYLIPLNFLLLKQFQRSQKLLLNRISIEVMIYLKILQLIMNVDRN